MTEVRYEPESALFGGEDGLDFYRAITELWRASVKDGGYIAYESGLGQHEAVKALVVFAADGTGTIELVEQAGGSAQRVYGEIRGDMREIKFPYHSPCYCIAVQHGGMLL